jgi:hypothetical protein
MRGHLIAKGLAWLGGGAFILLLLSASGVLDLLKASASSSIGSGTPLANSKWQTVHEEYVRDLRIQDAGEVGSQMCLRCQCCKMPSSLAGPSTLGSSSPQYVPQTHKTRAESAGVRVLQGLQMVLYGDDWVESWRGTSGGDPCPACKGIPDVWQRHFGHWRARAYGIAGAGATAALA